MPAEWAPHSRCWMAWPTRETIWGEFLQAAKEDYASIAEAIAQFEPVSMLAPSDFTDEAAVMCGPEIEIIPWELDDSWMRDIGPNFLKKNGETAVSVFHFNAWGRKYQKYRKDAALGHRMAEALGIRCFTSPIYMEGGGICTDGEGTLLTTEQFMFRLGFADSGVAIAVQNALFRGQQRAFAVPADATTLHVDG